MRGMFVPVVFGLFGLIVGSFLNVLILRRGKRPLTGRSACGACESVLGWHDLVPVLSWFVLLGRCRSCRSRISIQYPLVEGATALLFAAIAGASLGTMWTAFACVVAALLVAIFVYDLYHALIPDAWVWTFNALALLALIFNFQFSIFNFLAGPATALPLFALWFASGGRWMGFGDVKLALGMGWLLGPLGGIQALFLAFIVGALVSVPLLFFSSDAWKKMVGRLPPYRFLHRVLKVKSGTGYTMKSEVPFGPFLITATFIVWFLQMYGVEIPLITFL